MGTVTTFKSNKFTCCLSNIYNLLHIIYIHTHIYSTSCILKQGVNKIVS